MKVYVAGPFFNAVERGRMERLKKRLENTNNEYFFPMDHFIPNGEEMSNYKWAEEVFKMDEVALLMSDLVIAVYDKQYSDSGTAFEIGLAYGRQIPIILLCTDLTVDNSIMPIMAAHCVLEFEKFVNGDDRWINVENLTCLK